MTLKHLEKAKNLKEYFSPLLKPQHKNIVLVFCVLILFLFLWGASEFYSSYQSIQFYNFRTLQNLSLVLNEHVASRFEKAKMALSDVKVDLEEIPHNKWTSSRIQKMMKERFEYIPEALAMKMIDETGNYFADANGETSTANLSDRKYFQQHKTNADLGMIISEPVISKSTGKWILVCSVRLNDSQKKFRGLIILTYTLDSFQNFFSKLDVGRGGAIALFSKDYKLLSRFPFSEANLSQNVHPAIFFEEGYKGADFFITKKKGPIEKINKTFAVRLNKNYGFHIIVNSSDEAVLADWKEKLRNQIIIFIIMILILNHFVLQYLKTLDAITDQQKQAIQSAKFSSLGEMASGIAHEINNPLAVIRSLSSTLRSKIEKNEIDKEKMLASFDKIEFTVVRISKIIRGLRSFARNSDTDPFLETSLNGIIENTLEYCQERFKNNSVELTLKNSTDLKILCREAQISQVLLNLLNNSFDAISEIEEKWIKIDISQKEDTVIIQITDCGLGINNETVNKMMQPFFTTKEVGKGTGLGLSISLGIIQDHKGKLYYNKNSPHTQFIVELPTC